MKVCGRLPPPGVGGSLCVSGGSGLGGRAEIPGGGSRDDHAEGSGVKAAAAEDSAASVLTEVAGLNK